MRAGAFMVDRLLRLIVAVLVVTVSMLLHGAGAAQASDDATWHDYDGPANLSQAVTATPNQWLLSAPALGDDFDRIGAPLRLAADFVAPGSAVVRALDDVPFPDELVGGQSNVHVYFGVRDGKPVYTGITNDLGRRQTQHGDRFILDPLTTAPVTRGQARAIEQAVMERNPGFENVINFD